MSKESGRIYLNVVIVELYHHNIIVEKADSLQVDAHLI